MSGGDVRPNYYRVKVWAQLEGGERREVEVECFDLIDALQLDFYGGNALKYLVRAGRKTIGQEEDLKKAGTYIRQALERLEDQQAKRACPHFTITHLGDDNECKCFDCGRKLRRTEAEGPNGVGRWEVLA